MILHRLATHFLEYIRVYSNRTKQYCSWLSTILSNTSHPRVLDLGTRKGTIANFLAKNLHCRTVGLDVERDVMKDGPRLFDAVVADAHWMPFKANSFDAVLCISCLEHFDNPVLAVQEISRVCKPTASCVTQIPNVQWFLEPHTTFPFLCWMPNIIRKRVKVKEKYSNLNLSVTLKAIVRWFQSYGFRFQSNRPIYHGLPFAKFLRWPLGWFAVFKKSK